MKLSRLLEPFDEADVKWRVGRCGAKNNKPWATLFAYIDARAVQERLDEVFGMLGWQTRYKTDREGVVCEISVKDNEWITKSDGANWTDFEAYKGGISDAFKRAAAAGLGVGRYLYRLDENWTQGGWDKRPGYIKAYIKESSKDAYFPRPVLPVWAKPGGSGRPTDASHKLTGATQARKASNGAQKDNAAPEGSAKAKDDPFKFMAELFAGRDEKVDVYLMKVGFLSFGETWRSLKAEHIERIIKNPEEFMKCVEKESK